MTSFKNNQSIQEKTDQLVRYYQIPYSSEKEIVLNTIFEKIRKEEKSKYKTTRKISLIPLAGIAAAASIALIVAVYVLTASVSFLGENGNNLAFRLPDNSRVVLQDNSEISIRKYFWNRNVSLKGSAYFEVEKGDDFRVITELGEVEVLGTRFLVSEMEDSLNVQCFEGSVKASISNNSVILVPGTRFSGNSNSAVKETVEMKIEYPEFARFNKRFPNTGMANVTAELETFFGVEIEIKNGAERNFTGTIQTGKLDGALDILCASMQLQYKHIENNKILIYK